MKNPKKPHFFTFVSPHPHSQNGSLIPISFMQKYLNGEKSENALLKRGCKNWHVEIEGRRFVNGWEKFEKENGLELGDFIVFRHEGDFVFQVMVFGPSLCEKEYPPPFTTTGDGTKKNITTEPETKSSKEIPANIQATSKDVEKNKANMQTSNANSKPAINYPSFSAKLTQFGIKESVLRIPTKFARLNGLINKQCEMVIRDDRLREWPVKLRNKKRGPGSQSSVIGGGWSKLCTENDLKKGDEFVLELVETGEKPVMNLHSKSKDVKKEKEMMPPTYASAKSTRNHPSFSALLTRYSIKKSVLYVPTEFARLNGLYNRQCEMFIRDERLRPWTVKLRNEKGNQYSRLSVIREGWSKLCVGNGLKEGDVFVLELVETGEKPVMNFHLTSKDVKNDEEVMLNPTSNPNSSKRDKHSSFSATLSQSGIAMSFLHIPSKFARLNGLTNMQCEMIIRDERLRPWSVQLKNKKKSYNTSQNSFIAGGWRNFCIGNGLKQGDEVVLELVKKGEKPVMNFSLRTKPTKTCTKAETTNPSAGGSHSYFIASLNEFNIKKSTLYLPNGFARKNGLRSGEMILRNGNKGSWLVEVKDMGNCVYIGRGWRDFQVANSLMKGDFFKFELIENGKKPIANFSRMETLGKNAPKVENTSGETCKD